MSFSDPEPDVTCIGIFFPEEPETPPQEDLSGAWAHILPFVPVRIPFVLMLTFGPYLRYTLTRGGDTS